MIIFTYYNELIKLTPCHPSSKIYVTTMDPLLSLNPSSLKYFSLLILTLVVGLRSLSRISYRKLDRLVCTETPAQYTLCKMYARIFEDFLGFFLYPCKCYRLKIFRKYLRKNEILKMKYQRITNTYI